MEELTTVIFLGIQGSGKGTQTRLLQKYLEEHTNTKALYLETGQLLRNFAGQEGYTNELVDNTITAGELLPSFMPVYVLGREMIEHFTGAEHLIFDGAARRENQTVMIDSMMRMYGRTPYHVVVINIPEDMAVERMLGRGREDDTRESIQKRIAWSKENEQVVIEKFKGLNCSVHHIDGTGTIDEIHALILSELGLI
tara:strand:- start:2890 stop:3480 length:591 start_codon:yes stop_codon:yes gene_type:complete